MPLPYIIANGRQRLVTRPTLEDANATRAARPVVLDVTVPDQQRTNWCWAAVGVSIGAAYRDSMTQCAIARQVLTKLNNNKPVTCCVTGTDCNSPQALSHALNLGQGHLGRFTASVLPWDDVRDQIDRGYPLAVRIAYKGSKSGHVLVVHGYDSDASNAVHLVIGDPSSLTATVPLAKLLRNYRGGAWQSTYLTTGRQPVPRK